MIYRINDEKEIFDFNSDDIYAIRIKSMLKAYSTGYDFASFYVQENETNDKTAILSKLDGDFTLCVTSNADILELEEFFNVIGFNTILCDNNVKLSFKYNDGVVMSCNHKKELYYDYGNINEYPKLMELFNLTDYDTVDFENWYVDLSHRIRHNCAKAFTYEINNEIISQGILSSIYNDKAILSSVKTQSEFRRSGYGSIIVSAIVNDVRSTVYIMRENNINEHFYSNLGFENIGMWRMYK